VSVWQPATIDVQGLAGDEGSSGAGEEDDCRRDVLRLPPARHALPAKLRFGAGALSKRDFRLCRDLDRSRQNSVDANPVRAEFAREGSGQAVQPGLGGAIADQARPSGSGVDAAYVHYPTPAFRDRARSDCAAGAVVDRQIHLDRSRPRRLSGLRPTQTGIRPGVIDQDVHAAHIVLALPGDRDSCVDLSRW
jgi:hypothetical protein